VFADPGIHAKLPRIVVIAGCEMKARSIVFDLAFGLPSLATNVRCRAKRGDFMSAGSPPIRILSVDDHPLLRTGIEALVSSQPDMVVVAECSNGRDAIQLFRAHRPDVTLMDLQMPEMSGTDAMIAIRDEFPDARIIVLTTYAGDVQALRALQAGARGYLLKDAVHEELLETIRAVHAGKKTLSPAVSHEIAEHATEDSLTKGEIDVLRLIAEGKANKQIADHLSIAEETVKSRVKSILSKLSADDRTHAAMIGLKRGIIGP
jgi:DNA-binding NarL/FixJ family response regulator